MESAAVWLVWSACSHDESYIIGVWPTKSADAAAAENLAALCPKTPPMGYVAAEW